PPPPSDVTTAQRLSERALYELSSVSTEQFSSSLLSVAELVHFLCEIQVIESVASQHLWAVSDAGRWCKVRGSPAEASPSPAWESALSRWILDNRPIDYT
ncbi:hypothetical protein PO909_019766, partial [Leuciscus waleckii]